MSEGGGATILAPHLDDAVFSAWHVLARHSPVTVVTIFAGTPERGFVAALDRAHGAVDSSQWVERRRSEDVRALALAGARAVHLPLLDALYRTRRDPAVWRAVEEEPATLLPLVAGLPSLRTPPEQILDLLIPLVDATTTVYAPVGIGGHPDHQDVGRAALRLVDHAASIRLYADSPYFLVNGLPSLISHRHSPTADATVQRGLLEVGASRAIAHHVELTPDEVAHKDVAMRSYTTEFEAVDEDFRGIPSDASWMRHELWWSLK